MKFGTNYLINSNRILLKLSLFLKGMTSLMQKIHICDPVKFI